MRSKVLTNCKTFLSSIIVRLGKHQEVHVTLTKLFKIFVRNRKIESLKVESINSLYLASTLDRFLLKLLDSWLKQNRKYIEQCLRKSFNMIDSKGLYLHIRKVDWDSGLLEILAGRLIFLSWSKNPCESLQNPVKQSNQLKHKCNNNNNRHRHFSFKVNISLTKGAITAMVFSSWQASSWKLFSCKTLSDNFQLNKYHKV